MKRKMKALDLFCGAGGASMGLHRAGFEVTGVDIEHQPYYPFNFVQADALTFDLEGYDFIWASPKCQFATAYKRRPGHVRACENMIPTIRKRLIDSKTAYVIENVEGAKKELNKPILLCGSMFNDLDVQRHRLFESNIPILAPGLCNHQRWSPRFPPATNRSNLRRTVEIGVWRIPLEVQQAAIGINWMPLVSLSQAIPPAYAEFIGRSVLLALRQ